MKINKSEKIRETLYSLPVGERSPTKVASMLRAKGVKVTSSLVSVVKSVDKMKRKSRISLDGSRGNGDVKELVLAKKFLESVGSVQRAKGLLEIVDRIVN
jgi:hypothetical protein